MNYSRHHQSGPPLSIGDLTRLHASYAKSRRRADCDKLFRHHYGFAVRTAMKYVRPEFPSDEAISAAVHGLIEALKRYVPDKGAFTTFSFWWMLKFILREKAFSKDVVKLPVGLVRKSRRMRRLRLELGADDIAIAKELGVNVAELEQLEELHLHPTASGGLVNLGNAHIDESPNPREALELKEEPLEQDCMREELQEALKALTTRERTVVLARYCAEPRSFESLGKALGITHQGARKIYIIAMAKIKSYCGT